MIVSCGIIWSNRYLIFLMFPIVWICQKYIETEYIVAIDKKKDSFLFLSSLLYFSYLISGILELISKCISKRSEKKKGDLISRISLFPRIENKSLVVFEKYVYLIIIIISTVDCLMFVWTLYIVQFQAKLFFKEDFTITDSQLRHLQIKFVRVIINCILSKYVLYYPIYKHQLISLVIIIITSGISTVYGFLDQNQDVSGLLIQFIGIYAIWALKDIFEKWIMEIKHMSAFLLLFYEGCVGSFLSIVFIIICVNFNEGTFFKGLVDCFLVGFIDKNILFGIGYVLTSFGCGLLLLLISRFFTPIHRTIAEVVTPLIFVICQKTAEYYNKHGKENSIAYFVVNVIGLIIILFFSFVYNDMIIVHLCGMEKNTRKEIMKRGAQENEFNIEIGFMELENGYGDNELDNSRNNGVV